MVCFHQEGGLVDKVVKEEGGCGLGCLKEVVSDLGWVTNAKATHLDAVSEEASEVAVGGNGSRAS